MKGSDLMSKTLSLCQGKGCLAHNNRTFFPKNVDRTRTPDNVVFVQKPVKEAYEELFDEAVQEYNSRQKRKDRQIPGSYYEYQFGRTYSQNVIESPDKRKSFYEDVVQIGTKDDTGVGCPDSEAARECLTKYMNGFEQRNPNFRVFNAVLHMDEATPHLHIDYIPVGHYKRGIPVQNGISQALKEIGYGGGRDAIARWRKAEYDTLRKICEDHNIEIAEPQQSRGTLSVEQYKEQKHQEEYIEHMREMELSADSVEIEHKAMFGKHIISADEYEKINEEKKALAVQRTDMEQREKQLEKDKKEVADQLSRAENISMQAQITYEEMIKMAEEDQARAKKELEDAERIKKQAICMLDRQENINDVAVEAERRNFELSRQFETTEREKSISEKKYGDLKSRIADCMHMSFSTDDKRIIDRCRDICSENDGIREIINKDISLSPGDIIRPAGELMKIYSDKFHSIQDTAKAEQKALRGKYDLLQGVFIKVINAVAALIACEPYCSIIPKRAMDMLRAIQNDVYMAANQANDTELKRLSEEALTPKIDDEINEYYKVWKYDRDTEEPVTRGYAR